MKSCLIFLFLIMLSIASANDNRTVESEYFVPEKLVELENYLFDSPVDRDKIVTNSLLIIKDSKIIYERHKPPYNRHTKYLSWSIAKSITGLIIGIAEKEGLLNRHDPILKFFPWIQPLKGTITFDHLLRMSSGIHFSEVYEGAVWEHDVHSMLFKHGASDMGKYVLQLPMDHNPGERFYYSSGDSNLMMFLLKQLMDPAKYDRYPFEKLFKPLGISNATFEQDASGTFIGSSFVYLSSEDYAKIGQLFLNKGSFNKQQIVSKEWIEYMSTLTPSFESLDNIDSTRGYGAHLWLNYTLGADKTKIPVYPSLPIDTIFLQGIKGQLVTIIPSENIISVRAAFDVANATHKDYYFSLLLSAIKGSKHIPAHYPEIPKYIPRESKEVATRILEEGVMIPGMGINRNYFSLFKQVSNVTTHLICSCHFVQENSLEYCKDTYGIYTFIFKASLEPENSKENVMMSIYNLFGVGRAIYRNQDLGCTIID